MRKYSFLSLAAAALLLSACANDGDDPNNGGNGNAAGATKYLAVNIQNVGAAPTRADDGTYEDGNNNENHINKVRFYFFHADGSPYILKKTADMTDGGNNTNWLETSDSLDINKDDKVEHPNYEKITDAVLLINGITASAPATMIAIVNPETLKKSTLKNGEALSLNDLRQVITGTDFYKDSGSKANSFVMSNSVYLDAGTSVCSAIVSGHVAESAKAATASPVDVYVERVVAKVQADIDNQKFRKGTGADWSTDKYGIEVGTYGNNTKVYAVIDGWGVADEDGKAEIEKQIETSWTDATIGISPWSTADYHRSFWSKSVPFSSGSDGNQPKNHKFVEYTNGFDRDSVLYTLPNTPSDVKDFSDPYNNYLTKFLVTTHLRYQDTKGWHNAEICSYRGVEYLGVDNLKTEIANYYKKYYTKNVDGTYVTLKPDEITFSTTNNSTSSDNSIKDYQVVATLVNTDKAYYENKLKADGNHEWVEVSATDVNNSLAEEPAEVRKDGMAYYYIPIRHLATDPTKLGYYGIVRNHVYKIKLDNIKGFGTPVYDPNKDIDPTVPSDKKTFLAARINVLSWRVVSQDVDLDKTQK